MGTETTKRVNCEGEEEDALAVELGEVDVCNNFALVSQFSLGSLLVHLGNTFVCFGRWDRRVSGTRSDCDINSKGANGGVQGWLSGSGNQVDPNISRTVEGVRGLEEA